MSEEAILKQLDDFVVTLEFTLKDLNDIINLINQANQAPIMALASVINAIQMQAGPQVAKAREALEAVKNADGVPVELEEKN